MAGTSLLTSLVVALVLVVTPGCHGTFTRLPTRGGVVETSRVDPELGRIGTALAGKHVEVRCWTQPDWNRLVEDLFPWQEPKFVAKASRFGEIDLSPAVCRPLAVFLYETRRANEVDIGLAQAIGVFSHELEHVHGELDEPKAECHGMQRLARTARGFGISPIRARALAELYWKLVYPANDPEYVSPQCRNGGELDLRPRSRIWP